MEASIMAEIENMRRGVAPKEKKSNGDRDMYK